MKQHNLYLGCLLFITFISFFGIALPYPIMAPIFLSNTEPLSFLNISPSILYGITLAGYPLGQFCGSPILGVISDIYGRKITLVISLLMTCVGYLLSIYALSDLNFVLFALSRFFTGFWEGLMPITRAAAADLQHVIPKTKSFGYLNAAATLGFLFGPIAGGFLADHKIYFGGNSEIIFWFALILTILILPVLIFCYQDNAPRAVLEKSANPTLNILKKIKYTWAPLRKPKYFYVIIMSTLITLGFDIYYQFYPLYLVTKWQVTAYDIAIATVVLAITMILTQVFLIKRLNRLFTVSTNIMASGFCYSIIISLMLLTPSYNIIVCIFAVLGVFVGIIGTNLPVLISDITPANIQGQIMGLMMSLRFLGDGIMCLVGGILSSFSPIMPFILASTFVILGTFMFISLNYRGAMIIPKEV